MTVTPTHMCAQGNSQPAVQPLASGLPGTGQGVWGDKLSQLLESTGEGIFGIDMFGCCTFINRAGAELLGWLPGVVLGQNMHELAHHTHAGGGPYPEHL